VCLRQETAEDREFVCVLYAGTRAEEMALVPWSDAQKEAFLRSQYELQTAHYRHHYPQAAFLIIVDSEMPIGRLYVDRTPEDIHILDISLISERRGQGLGTEFLRELIVEADASGKTVSLYVEKFNPAQRLYQRLGFVAVKDEGVYWMLIRAPQPATPGKSADSGQ
jgi:ribosomal protein S18 acetylase RimI-like enzyme